MADLAHGLITRSGFEVAENEGLALVSSNAFTTAWACIATADAAGPAVGVRRRGRARPGGVRRQPHLPAPGHRADQAVPGLAATLHQLRLLLAGSYLWRPGAARFLQDPLTFRCIPHIHGAARDALGYTRNILQLELNSSQSNPVVVVPAGARPDRLGRQLRHRPARRRPDFLRIAFAAVQRTRR